MKYEKGDIVFASNAVKMQNNDSIKSHLYVIIDDDGNIVPAEYFGFVVSSRIEKSKNNSPFKYNEPIMKNDINNLDVDSIVKCDQLMSIPKQSIQCKIGSVQENELNTFLDAFDNYLGTVNT